MADIEIVFHQSVALEFVMDFSGPDPLPGTAGFIMNAPSTIFIHGWDNGRNSEFPVNSIRTAMAAPAATKLLIGNVISIDYSQFPGVKDNYNEAIEQIDGIGQLLYKKFLHLQNAGYVQFRTMHIVCYSLGGQITGALGKLVNKLGPQNMLARITALDVTGVKFEHLPVEKKLNSGDARLVIVIHTSDYGHYLPSGSRDYYPNYYKQPGYFFDLWDIEAHAFSHVFFNKSITRAHSFECYQAVSVTAFKEGELGASHDFMRLYVRTGAGPGRYFLETNPEFPHTGNPWHP